MCIYVVRQGEGSLLEINRCPPTDIQSPSPTTPSEGMPAGKRRRAALPSLLAPTVR